MTAILNYDITQLFEPSLLLAIILGTFVGMLIGAMPGLGPTIAMVMLIPLTYSLTPTAAVLLLLAAYQAAEYGGSISSIVLGIPGTVSAVATVLDGNALARKGAPGKALGYSLTASTIGGLIGGLALIFMSGPMSKLASKMSDPEYVLLAIAGLIVAATISGKNFLKSLMSVGIGLLLSTVGVDIFTGVRRFTFGTSSLVDGLKMISLIIGFFAITEVFNIVGKDLHTVYATADKTKGLNTHISLKELKDVALAIVVGSVLGSFLGGVPGLGPAIATFLAYSIIKKIGKKGTVPYGEGNPLGIAAPESANNAAVGGNIMPLLVFGIPNNSTIAIVMSAFIVHGVKPGPKVFVSEPDLVAGILLGFLLTTVVMFIIGKCLTPLFAKALLVPNNLLMTIVLVISILGTYASEKTYFSVAIAIAFGVVGFFLKKLDFSEGSIVLAFVLGPMIEENYRRTLLVSRGSNMIFLQRPISLALIGIMVIFFVSMIIFKIKKYKAGSSVKTASSNQ
ncbi:MAG: tripartite tricarboxylate transporter permease [Oscillospiraceae bacterium]